MRIGWSQGCFYQAFNMESQHSSISGMWKVTAIDSPTLRTLMTKLSVNVVKTCKFWNYIYTETFFFLINSTNNVHLKLKNSSILASTWTRVNVANDKIKIVPIVLCLSLGNYICSMCVSACVCRVYPPTVVMGPPEEFLARRALGLCGLRKETIMIRSHCPCLLLKHKKTISVFEMADDYLACSRGRPSCWMIVACCG